LSQSARSSPTTLGELKALALHFMDKLTSIRNCKTSEIGFRALLGKARHELENSSSTHFGEQAFEDAISCAKRTSYVRMDWGQTREKKVRWHLAQIPTAVLGLLIVSLVMLVAVAGAAVIQRRVPVEVRKTHTTGLGQIQGALGAMFGVIVGFSAFLVLNKHHTAIQTVQTEAAEVVEIYRLAEPLPEAKQEPVQRLDASYARVVVEEEWPLMRQGRASPRADALIKELRESIQGGYKTSTGTEQDFFGEQLRVIDDLESDRVARLVILRQHLPYILWVSLIVLAILLIGFSYMIGMESRLLHLLAIGAMAGGIALVLFTIAELDQPFGMKPPVSPEPFELVLHEIEAGR
jgi:hypothetical protein